MILKKEKAAVNYKRGLPQAHCGICAHYRQDGRCELVKGVIKPAMWCKLFARKAA